MSMFSSVKAQFPTSYFDHLRTLAEIRHAEARGDDQALARDPVYCGLIASLATCEALAAIEGAGQECHEELIDTAQESTAVVADALEGLTEALQGLIPAARSSRVPRARA